MIIKICGVTSIEIAKAVEDYGANWIGFVFANSSRKITPEKAQVIAEQLSPQLKKVGVFVNESVETMNQIAKKIGLDYIQLHGDESAETAKQLNYPVIRALSINDINDQFEFNYPAAYYLIDSPGETYRGGSGKTFNWDRLKTLAIDQKKVILAGGLSPTNIHQAIQTVQPTGVDVSSGVETDGKKDIDKIKQFIKNARTV